MDRSVILQNFLDGAAVTEPEEFRAPEEFAILADAPATTGSFADKRMVVPLALSATARPKANRPKPSAGHSDVKITDAVGAKESKGDFRRVRVVGLHQDPAHT
jgi:hypothetical protein